MYIELFIYSFISLIICKDILKLNQYKRNLIVLINHPNSYLNLILI